MCRLIEKLNEAECSNLPSLLVDELGCLSLNDLWIKIMIHLQDMLTSNCIESIEIKLKQMVENRPKSQSQSQSQSPGTHKRKDTHTNKHNKEILFPLSRMPIDLLKNTSFFLNEKDIFYFERCCRLFYQMIKHPYSPTYSSIRN